MASFKQRKGKWVIRFYDSSRDPKETRESFSIEKTKQEIKKLELKMNLAYEEDWDPWRQSWKQYQLGNDPESLTLKEAHAHYAQRKVDNGDWSEKTKLNYDKFFSHFIDELGPRTPISQIDERIILRYLNRGLKPSTFDTYLSYIKTFLNWIRKNGGNIKPVNISFKHEETTRKYVTPEQLKAIQNCYRDKSYRRQKPSRKTKFEDYDAAFGLIFYMCLRASEALGLRRKDYDRKNIMLRRKGGKRDWRHLMPEANNYFMRLYNKTSEPDDLLIPVGYRSLYDMWTTTRKAALGEQAQGLTLHHLRHGGAMYYLYEFDEIDREWLKHFLSHEDYETTGIYVEMTQDRSRSVVERAYRNKQNFEYTTGPEKKKAAGDSKGPSSGVAGE